MQTPYPVELGVQVVCKCFISNRLCVGGLAAKPAPNTVEPQHTKSHPDPEVGPKVRCRGVRCSRRGCEGVPRLWGSANRGCRPQNARAAPADTLSRRG